MSSFTYNKDGKDLFLLYKIDETEAIDGYALGIITSKRMQGIIETKYVNDAKGKYLKYKISSMMNLKELMKKGVDDKGYCMLLHGIASTLEMFEKNGLNPGSIVLNEELIYYDTNSRNIKFICIPSSGYINVISSKQILCEFSKLIIGKMKVTNNLILQVNNYLLSHDFVYSEFNCLINSIVMNSNAKNAMPLTRMEYVDDDDVEVSDKVSQQVTKQPEIEALLEEERKTSVDENKSVSEESKNVNNEKVEEKINKPFVNVAFRKVVDESLDMSPIDKALDKSLELKIASERLINNAQKMGEPVSIKTVESVDAKVEEQQLNKENILQSDSDNVESLVLEQSDNAESLVLQQSDNVEPLVLEQEQSQGSSIEIRFNEVYMEPVPDYSNNPYMNEAMISSMQLYGGENNNQYVDNFSMANNIPLENGNNMFDNNIYENNSTNNMINNNVPLGMSSVSSERGTMGMSPIGKGPIGKPPIGDVPIGNSSIGNVSMGNSPVGAGPLRQPNENKEFGNNFSPNSIENVALNNMNKREEQPQLQVVSEASEKKDIKELLNGKIEELQKLFSNLKESVVNGVQGIIDKIKGNKETSSADDAEIQSNYEEEIRQKVAQVKDEEKQQMEDMKMKFEQNRLFDNNQMVNMNGLNRGMSSRTVKLDCVTGQSGEDSSVDTSVPYLIRVSTGEKININLSLFKLGRGRKFVDYYVGGNDTISKVHAYITNKANDYYLVDNSSKNHTYLDGKVLQPVQQELLRHHSKIRLAKEEFVFCLY